MKNIKQLSFVLFILSALAFSYPVAQVFAQGGGQCDSNPACNPNYPNGIPCCSSGSNNMSSGTLPPRIPAPSGHDKMNHENRKLSDKSDLPEGQELRDSFMGCQRELKNRIEQIQNLQDNAVQSSCGRGASQANRDQNTIRELRGGLYAICDTFHDKVKHNIRHLIGTIEQYMGICRDNGWRRCAIGGVPGRKC